MVSEVTANSVSLRDAAANSAVTAGASTTTGSTASAIAGGGASASLPNPRAQFDPSLNLVVLEFDGSAGQVVNSIPSQSQLNAYQFNPAAQSTPAGATV
jgi:hypothetical protein